MEWSFDAVVEWFESDSAQTVLRALLGLLVFVAGWPVARLLSAGAFWLARRISGDPRLASLAGLPAHQEPLAGAPVEHRGAAMVARVVFVLVMCAAFLAGLYVSDLTTVSEPLARFSIAVEEALPVIGRAALILLISYIAARMLRRGVTVGLRRMRLDDRLASARAGEPAGAPPPERAFSEQVGLVTYWLVLAFGLAATVESLDFVPLSTPIRDALDRVIALLPALGSALIILAGGGLLAWLTRRVVRSLLESAGFDRLVRRIDIGRTLERVSPSAVVGLGAMLFVLAEAVIAALDQLHLTSVSAPLTAAVTEVGAALPDIGLGLLILILGHIAGRLARRWVERLADELRLDAVLERIGVLREADGAGPPSTSSRVLGAAAYILVLLVAAQQAFAAAGLSVWAGHVSALLAFSVERVGIAALIVLVGFALGTQARNQVIARGLGGPETTSWIGGAARIMVLVFAFTMAIHHLGVAERFVTMAFGFAFGGLCLALALAFGLGGREITAELLKRRLAELTEARRRAEGREP
ncbi:MAG TPA: mechanosensitive ion channel, partial [Kofleriaceae bacterium]|nr:mechanosensitive ion channel [Kofleriaceae bacterium]